MQRRDERRFPAAASGLTESYFAILVDLAMHRVQKIVITGAESSGKTTLAEALAAHFGTLRVHEAARSYLDAKAAFGTTAGYVEQDLLAIARLQVQLEDSAVAHTQDPPLLFCDTDLITIRIWGEEKYGRSDPWVVRMTEERPYALWLLCSPDIPWEPDPLRENPHDRDRLFTRYAEMLRALGKPFVVVSGDRDARLAQAVAAVEAMGR